MSDKEPLIPKHGGYRHLKTFQLAQLIYGLTVRFCDLYIDRHSRTRDQMVQAARSGVQNIAEGSQASGTSRAGKGTVPFSTPEPPAFACFGTGKRRLQLCFSKSPTSAPFG